MIGKGVVSSEDRRNWERLQNRKTTKMLDSQDSLLLMSRDLPAKRRLILPHKQPVSKAQEMPKLLGKRTRDSDEGEDKKKVQKLSAVRVETKDSSQPAAAGVKAENGSAVKSPIRTPKLMSSLPETKDKNRDKFRDLLAGALSKVSGEVPDSLKAQVDKCDPFRMAAEVESALYSKWGLFNGAQKYKYRSIMFNIRDPKNPDFRRKVLLGVYPPEVFPQLTSELMASDERQSENEKIKEKALFECERGIKPEASTGAFKCGRCHKWETTYYQLQTRCADEPMTTYVTCLNCNKHWKC